MNDTALLGGSREVVSFLPTKNVASEIKDFFETSREQARLVIRERMPMTILRLNKMLQEKDGYRSFFEQLEKEGPTKRTKENHAASSSCEDGHLSKGDSVEASSKSFLLAEREFEALKLEVLELVEMTSSVKLWLQLNVPRIEDGNNFGVSIQTDTVAELARIEDSALMTVENWSKFLMVRSKIVGKVCKYAGREAARSSYLWTLEAMDEKQLRSVWIGWMDLRNNYAVIWDLLAKNLEKLINPRSSNAVNMY